VTARACNKLFDGFGQPTQLRLAMERISEYYWLDRFFHVRYLRLPALRLFGNHCGARLSRDNALNACYWIQFVDRIIGCFQSKDVSAPCGHSITTPSVKDLQIAPSREYRYIDLPKNRRILEAFQRTS
jgi:hypothetical protein